MKFKIEKKMFEKYPNLKVGIIVVNNLDNNINIDIEDYINNVSKEKIEKFKDVELANYNVIKSWREIYKSFGEKKARSSVEALIRRTLNQNPVKSINPLVDIYNLISLKYEVPCGGEDLDKINDDIILGFAEGCEEFISLGEDEVQIVNKDEVVYKFNNTVICRNFNYRESDLTKLTNDTKRAVLVIESICDDNLDSALEELEQLVKDKLNCETNKKILDVNNFEMEI